MPSHLTAASRRGDMGSHINDIVEKKNELTRIRISNHALITEEEFDSLISAIAECRHLKQLVLNWCGINDNRVMKLARVLPKLTNLCELDFAPNSIGDEGALSIANILPSLPNLKELDLANNSIRDQGAMAIAAAMQQVGKRGYLDLRYTLITDAFIPTLV
jgi:Ran GTPase-activating protein (RanGAP) involved in mRNA processing and transport